MGARSWPRNGDEAKVSRNFWLRTELRTVVTVYVDVRKRFPAKASVREVVTATEVVEVHGSSETQHSINSITFTSGSAT